MASELSKAKKKLKTAKKTFLAIQTRTENYLNLEDEEVSKEAIDKASFMFENSVERFHEKYNEQAQIVLELLGDNEEEENRVIEEQAEVSDLLSSLKATINLLSKKNVQKNVIDTNPTPSTVYSNSTYRLPKLDIPTFDGDFIKFYSFKNRFESCVHNTSMDKAIKLQYLSNALVGKAEEVVRDFETNNLDYDEAWSHFLSNYENKRAIIAAHFARIRDIEPIKVENGIRDLITQVNASVRGLKCCDLEIDDTFSQFLTFLVVSKLDKFTSRDWQNSLKTTDNYPKFEELELFLRNRTFAAEERGKPLTNSENKDPKKSDRRSYVTVNEKNVLFVPEIIRCLNVSNS